MLRVVALGSLLLAGGGWLALVAPARRARDAARAEYALARRERERLRTELAAVEKRAQAGRAPADAAAAGRALRLALLHATDGLRVAQVQIAAAGERGRPGAHGQLSAEGRIADLLLLADRLAQPGSGVRIERVELTQVPGQGSARRLEIQGVSAEASS